MKEECLRIKEGNVEKYWANLCDTPFVVVLYKVLVWTLFRFKSIPGWLWLSLSKAGGKSERIHNTGNIFLVDISDGGGMVIQIMLMICRNSPRTANTTPFRVVQPPSHSWVQIYWIWRSIDLQQEIRDLGLEYLWRSNPVTLFWTSSSAQLGSSFWTPESWRYWSECLFRGALEAVTATDLVGRVTLGQSFQQLRNFKGSLFYSNPWNSLKRLKGFLNTQHNTNMSQHSCLMSGKLWQGTPWPKGMPHIGPAASGAVPGLQMQWTTMDCWEKSVGSARKVANLLPVGKWISRLQIQLAGTKCQSVILYGALRVSSAERKTLLIAPI